MSPSLIRPEVAEAHIPDEKDKGEETATGGEGTTGTTKPSTNGGETSDEAGGEAAPTRFIGTVMISSERPARDMHQIVEAIVKQLTTLPCSQVSLKLEIDAEVPDGLDRAKVRTLIENATTFGFIDKAIK